MRPTSVPAAGHGGAGRAVQPAGAAAGAAPLRLTRRRSAAVAGTSSSSTSSGSGIAPLLLPAASQGPPQQCLQQHEHPDRGSGSRAGGGGDGQSQAPAPTRLAPPSPRRLASPGVGSDGDGGGGATAAKHAPAGSSRTYRPGRPRAGGSAGGLGAAAWPPARRPAAAAAAPLPAPLLTAKLRSAGSVLVLVARCERHGEDMNPIHISAALVAAARLVEAGRWLPESLGQGPGGGGQGGDGAEAVRARLDAAVARLVSRLAALRALCGGREIGNALWALARLGAPPPEPLLRALLGQFADALPGTSCTSIAHVLHALAVMGLAPDPAWTDQVLYSFLAHATRARRRASSGGGGVRDRDGGSSSSGDGGGGGPQAAADAQRDPWECSAQAVATVVWSLGRIGQRHVARVWAPALVKLLHGAAPASAVVAANVLVGVARLGLAPAHEARRAARYNSPAAAPGAAGAAAAFADDLARLLAESAPLLRAAAPRELAAIAWAAGQLELSAGPAWEAAFWSASLAALPSFPPRALSAAAHGAARARLAPPDGWARALLGAVAAAGGGFSAGELSGLLWALARLGIRPEPAWMEAAVGTVAQRLEEAVARSGGGDGAAGAAGGGGAVTGSGSGSGSSSSSSSGGNLTDGGAASKPWASGDWPDAGSDADSDAEAKAGVGAGSELREAGEALSRTVRALALARYRPSAPALARLLAGAHRLLPGLRPHAATSLLWGLTAIGAPPPLPLLRALLARCGEVALRASAGDAVRLAWTLSKLQGHPRALGEWLRRRSQQQRLLLDVVRLGINDERGRMRALRGALASARAARRAAAAAAAGEEGGASAAAAAAEAGEREAGLLSEIEAARLRLRGLAHTWTRWHQSAELVAQQLHARRARWRAVPGAAAAAEAVSPALVEALFLRIGSAMGALTPRQLAHALWSAPWLGFKPGPDWADAARARLADCAPGLSMFDCCLVLWAAAWMPSELPLPPELLAALMDRSRALLAAAAAAPAAGRAAAALPQVAPAPAVAHAAAGAAAAPPPQPRPPLLRPLRPQRPPADAAPGPQRAAPAPSGGGGGAAFSPQDALMLAWGLSEAGARPGRAWSEAFCAALARALPSMTGLQLGVTLRALARLRAAAPAALLDAAETRALVNSAVWEPPVCALVSASVLQLRGIAAESEAAAACAAGGPAAAAPRGAAAEAEAEAAAAAAAAARVAEAEWELLASLGVGPLQLPMSAPPAQVAGGGASAGGAQRRLARAPSA
ncbi:hypothetical protein Rsub_09682 [Raphidocelis subcapitata]|uniref:RAP domain-containing protein n=1 Tax=Raphidocelis subcapitata TaxID=307507 RepID=A0A2V0PAF1_9CHLO|nr:hypothetical protein Rsub_09682 [Raphidocelis subcapitata]|eukprot:GBF96826.1 hypothetical protein Rsub_09682 [Raphidocelis subcapitata]